jgi:hypothetical protein
MKTTTKLSLVAIVAIGVLATMGIGAAQAAKHQAHAATACTAEPGDLDALFCAPAPVAPPHHAHGKK